MRKVDVEPRKDRTWSRWMRDCERKTNDLIERAKRGEALDVDDRKLYARKTVRDGYFFDPDGPFAGKCAYCESSLETQHGDIEHFRPKAEVTDAEHRVVYLRTAEGVPVLDASGSPTPHPGYYWLAYDSRNLLPSCQTCNQKHKKTRFPVAGQHAQSPDEAGDEKPLLLHPLEDDPEPHLQADLSSGLLLHTSDRGETTVEILGLNRRDQLVAERKKAVLEIEALVIRAKIQRRKSASKKLRDILAGKHPFSLFQKAALKQTWPGLDVEALP